MPKAGSFMSHQEVGLLLLLVILINIDFRIRRALLGTGMGRTKSPHSSSNTTLRADINNQYTASFLSPLAPPVAARHNYVLSQ